MSRGPAAYDAPPAWPRRGTGPAAPRLRGFPERGLVFVVRAMAVLLVAAPLVVTGDVMHPTVLGRVVFARTLIELMLALWVVLAAFRPAWRPPRSPVLVLAALAVGVGLLAGLAGAAPERSLWSTPGRLAGVVGEVHWLAAAVVVAAVFRTPAEWRVLLRAGVAVGVAAAALAVASYYRVELPFYGLLPEPNYPRVGATLGNPTFLGGYLAIAAVLAAGAAAGSFADRRTGAARAATWRGAAWLLAAAPMLWAVTLSGSLGAAATVGAGLLAGGVACGLCARSRTVRTGSALAALVAAVAVAGAPVVAAAAVDASPRDDASPRADGAAASGADARAARERQGNPLRARVRDRGGVASQLAKRADLWRAGLLGFLERPALGWGPENYTVAFGRHTSGWSGPAREYDRAHNRIVEEAVTKGVPGVLAYVALVAWSWVALVRAARRTGGAGRATAVCVAAASGAHVGYGLTLFDVPSTALMGTLVVAFAASADAARARAPVRKTSGAALGVRVAAVASAACLVVVGAFVHRAVYAGERAVFEAHRGDLGRMEALFVRGIHSFEPLGNMHRTYLFAMLGAHWPLLHGASPEHALGLYRLAEAEAPAALAAEPRNWFVRAALVRMYGAAAAPDAAERRREHAAAARELAPNIDPLDAP